jgi:hypothetical protein
MMVRRYGGDLGNRYHDAASDGDYDGGRYEELEEFNVWVFGSPFGVCAGCVAYKG